MEFLVTTTTQVPVGTLAQPSPGCRRVTPSVGTTWLRADTWCGCGTLPVP